MSLPSSSTAALAVTATPNWHDAFPAPSKTTSGVITPTELKEKILASRLEGGSKDFLVVDVRRTDFDVAFIPNAINLPAHSFYPTLASLLPIFKQYESIIFHCQSSSGRGPRCAGWYGDELSKLGWEETNRSLVLVGGIKAWVREFGEEEDMVVRLPEAL